MRSVSIAIRCNIVATVGPGIAHYCPEVSMETQEVQWEQSGCPGSLAEPKLSLAPVPVQANLQVLLAGACGVPQTGLSAQHRSEESRGFPVRPP
jgi:hypothetical protein